MDTMFTMPGNGQPLADTLSMIQDNESDDGQSEPCFTGLPAGEFDYATYRAGKKRRRLRDRKLWVMVVVGLTVYILVEVFITKGKLTEALRPRYF